MISESISFDAERSNPTFPDFAHTASWIDDAESAQGDVTSLLNLAEVCADGLPVTYDLLATYGINPDSFGFAPPASQVDANTLLDMIVHSLGADLAVSSAVAGDCSPASTVAALIELFDAYAY
jgi:hypothetical protein